MDGFAGKQLRIDLTKKEINLEDLDTKSAKLFLGGVGYAAKIMYEEIEPGIDPLSPENVMVIATGPLSLAQVPGGGSVMLCFKSPLTMIMGTSRVGGDFGPDLKKAGLDHLIITGRASEPVYLIIENQRAEFRPAAHLIGMTVSEKTKRIREELGETRMTVLCIGLAGENLVKFSSVMSDDRAAGRCGGGAVWGSKNLIAIAVRGSARVESAKPEEFKKTLKIIHHDIKTNPMFVGLKSFGTIGDLPSNDDGGDWPTKNWQSNSWGKAPELFDHYQENNFLKGFGCYKGCTLACARQVHVDGEKFKTPKHGGAEYESISCFTAYLLNENMDAAIHCTYLCNEYGLDTISCGAMIAFAMECFEKDLLPKEVFDGLDLTWGNSDVLPILVKKIALREGIGDLLAEGVRNAARKIGPNAAECAIHVKGLEGPAHDPRSGKALAISYATGNRGMCHIQPLEAMAWDRGKMDWGMQKFGVPDPNTVDRWDEAGKGSAVATLQNGLVLPDVLGTCKFYMYAGVTVDDLAKMVSELTGWEMDGKELLKVGERAINQQRLFNIREGINAQDDWLPKRVMAVPAFGKYSSVNECAISDLESMLLEYYKERRWDPTTGMPSPEKCRELGLA